jgi:uroporphyrinogen decarboxylase
MKPRERLLTVLSGKIPDCVPVAPDFSNMIPARLTGKPFWQLYLYNDPPLWEAYIEAAKYFNIDSLMDGYFPLSFPEETRHEFDWQPAIVFRSEERIVTQRYHKENRRYTWAPIVDVYYVADPPTNNVPPAKIGLPDVPNKWEPLEGVKPVDNGPEGLKRAKQLLGDQGLLGVFCASTAALNNPQEIYAYYDHPELHQRWAEERIEYAEQRFRRIMAMEVKPDFLCVGGSGTLVFQNVKIFRQLALPAVKHIIELASAAGMPTHIHSCGPEKELVKIFATETNLTVIDPLEVPPMGDCNLAELKKLYGQRIVLKGNLHTTAVMLHGTPEQVAAASRKAIDAAAEGGRFILSTGDQCGRDTPFENLRVMIETARTYGKY